MYDASQFDNIVEEIIEEMPAAANSSTGGSSSYSETVVTGNSSASVQVTNVINADNNGGTSHTIIEKTVNGVKEVVEETKHFDPGEPVIVETTAEAHTGGEHASAHEDTSEDTGNAASSTEEGAESSKGSWSLSAMFSAVTEFFSSVFSWW